MSKKKKPAPKSQHRHSQTTSRAERQAKQTRPVNPWLVAAGLAIVIVIIVLAVTLGGGPPDRPLADVAPADRNNYYSRPPETVIDAGRDYQAVIETEKGDITVDLFEQDAPVAVNNWVFLVRQGFYDGVTFHRVMDGFMAQGGDPAGTGAGGPGYSFEDEFQSGRVFDRAGLLAMANSGPNTNGSQFFITFAPAEWLNGKHTIFGEVTQGDQVLDALTRRDPQANPTFRGDLIKRITILADGQPF